MNKILLIIVAVGIGGIISDAHGTYFSAKNWSRHLTDLCTNATTRAAAIKQVNAIYHDNNKSWDLNMSQMQAVFNACGLTTKSQQQDILNKLADYQICKYRVYKTSADTVRGNGCLDYCRARAAEIGCTANGRVQKDTVNNKCICNAKSYMQVCGKDKGNSGGQEYCVTDFNDSVTGQFQMLQATGIAKEYARAKYNINDLRCSNNYRTEQNQDFVQCVSPGANAFFEFEFDDVLESVDSTIQDSVKRAIAKILGRSYVYYANNYTGGYRGNCDEKLRQLSGKFGYQTESRGDFCQIVRDSPVLPDAINPYDINRTAFYKGIQVQADNDILAKIRQYVKGKLIEFGKNLQSFDCDFNTRQINNINGGVDKDDLLICRVNGETVQFVFDDMSESWKTYDRGGRQAMDCIVQGGTYNGRDCMHLSKQQCDKISGPSSECKQCRAAKWNESKQICELSAASMATSIEKGVGIASVVVGAAAAVIAVVGTGGTAAIVLVSTGAAMSVGSEIAIQSTVQPWFEETAKCKQPQCARKTLEKSMKQMVNLSNDFTRAESAAVEDELVRLINLVDDDMIKELRRQQNTKVWELESWDGLQAVRAIGNVLMLAGGLKGVEKIVGKNDNWQNLAKALKTRLDKVDNAVGPGRVQHAANIIDKAANVIGAGNDISIGNFNGAGATGASQVVPGLVQRVAGK